MSAFWIILAIGLVTVMLISLLPCMFSTLADYPQKSLAQTC